MITEVDGPTVSVVVTVRNGERYLAQALESIRTQIFGDFECIVVDDASTDGSRRIAAEFSERDSRFSSAGMPYHVGSVNAFNWGVLRARGHHFAFLAADDYWLPEFLEWCLAALGDDAAGVYTDFIEYDEPMGIKRVRRVPDFSYGTFARGDYVNFSSLLLRDPIFLDRRWEPVADWEGLLRLVETGRPLHRLPAILSVRRIHPGQESAQRRADIVAKSFLLAAARSPRAGLWRLYQAFSWPFFEQTFK